MSASVAARWVVLDIEGTLTPTSQVHVVLYDYARPRLGPWIHDHPEDPVVRKAVEDVKSEAGLPAEATAEQVVAVLHGWMDADRKAAPLKTLQGLIWQDGYARGELTTDYFADVVPALRAWRQRGLVLAVFSSGSVAGQVASFSHTTSGDLRGLFAQHFDTVNAGPKRERGSYEAIAAALGAARPLQIVFLSDVPAELDAAAQAGWHTVGLARPGEPYADADFGSHPAVGAFDDIDIEVVS
ncbi:acireductone synthase [Saccharopolyspora erythraea NRRL 2338]|uniref:Enolase-phosphatase E1 n=3 Tax=Saccharopolyspora erythraea TaxID=1836 RepID=MTNC_SACEN|nr:acireductone synthase [Saccharopolyspora erythraea]A4FFQ6.1 RecName: Full=Enolase-phosphatase E1; AltName: Full=2,3-diketo-5-methylthio-1-phosphopentane phosphatase [Saccharopolyspora erythraea NRRL 2338]PFG96599.1 acireductone synthase [Saccharopolyspora erythraea NRRL 2338]QRK93075.1 acireductone synthase [Saccharopolyspora erythraea]CAM02881.1 enolase-phosphatase E-1 [Saccharopolyspora erythraea NRRL 2338]